MRVRGTAVGRWVGEGESQRRFPASCREGWCGGRGDPGAPVSGRFQRSRARRMAPWEGGKRDTAAIQRVPRVGVGGNRGVRKRREKEWASAHERERKLI